MRRRAKAFVLGSAMAALLAWCYTRPSPISGAEATRLAEEFIVRNGYTDLPPDRTREPTREVISFSSDIEEEFRLRHDTLERRAESAYRIGDGWWVAFRYKDRLGVNPDVRRAVAMDAQGKKMHMIHEDVY